MASSREAFDKLRKWKKSNTVLRVTVVANGITNRHAGQIFGLDENLSLVGIVLRGVREHFQLDLGGATFKVGNRTLEAERGEDEFVVFVEL